MKLLLISFTILLSITAVAQGKFTPDSIKHRNYKHGVTPNYTDIQNYYGTDSIIVDTFERSNENVFELYYPKHGISFLFTGKDSLLTCFKIYLDSFPYKIDGYMSTYDKNITLKEVHESYKDLLYMEYDALGKTLTLNYENTSWVVKTSLGKQKSFNSTYTQSSDIYLMLDKVYSKKPSYVYVLRNSQLVSTD